MILTKIILQQLVISLVSCYVLLVVNEKVNSKKLKIFGVAITVLIALLTALSITLTYVRQKELQTNPMFFGQQNSILRFNNPPQPSLKNLPQGSMGSLTGQTNPGLKKMPTNKQ